MDKAQLIKLALTAAALFGTYKFVKNDKVRAAVLGIAGVVIVRNMPIVNQYVAI